MSRIPPHIIDDIMQTSRIEEVVGEFVQLKRAGANLKGLSPFTDEKTPSFVVSPAKQIFKCFSTGIGGSVVTFLMEKEHYTYPEALKWLAEKYNIQIPDDEPQTPEELERISERESLYIINDFARDHFVNNLHNTDEGKRIGLSYFIERGFRPEIIEKFQLGYCLNVSDDFTKSALEKQYKPEYLEKVGLTKSKDDRQFDFFRGRVMFPIHSISGRVLGFGGRTLQTDKKIAKYFNSPESIIYNKSEILYGLYFAKGDIIKYDECFLCEGYTDVISMYQAGIQNVVSSSGTSLTKEQVRLIKRYTKNVTILYDGDAAGIKASFRGIDIILEEGLNVKVVLFPEGEDPDSYSKSVSSSELENYIQEHKQDFISFKADILLEGSENDPIQRSGLIKDIIHSVSLIPDPITRNVYIQTIADQFDMNESVLTSELIKLRQSAGTATPQELTNSLRKPQPKPQPRPNTLESKTEKSVSSRLELLEREIIRIMLAYGPNAINIPVIDSSGKTQQIETSVAEYIVNELMEDEIVLASSVCNKIFQIYVESLNENTFLKASYLKRSEDQSIVNFIAEIELENYELSHNWVAKYKIYTSLESDKLIDAVPKAVGRYKLAKIESRINEIQGEKSNIENDDQLFDLLTEEKRLQEIRLHFNKILGRV